MSEAPRQMLRRDLSRRWIAGLCAGVARRFGIEVWLVRLALIVVSFAGGAGVVLYLVGWILVPPGEPGSEPPRRRLLAGRAALEVAVGTALLLLSVLLTFRALGVWFSDAIAWPLVLVAGGGALIWRQSVTPRAPRPEPPPASVLTAPESPAVPGRVRTAAGMSHTGLGVALVIAAGVVFLQATGALSAARDVLLSVVVAVVVLGVIFAPWIARLVRSLTSERAERIRSQERAEVAAHLHDSVLQTLAMVQRRAGEPQEVAAIARRQERELRAWLAARPAPGQAARLAPALEAGAAEVEERYGVPVEVVVVGDRPLDPAVEALIAAAREAMTNAAKFGAGSTVDVYAESSNGRSSVYVRDRGPGFDPARVPEDRRGVRESIIGRMERHGGRATITSAGGTGTEVKLVLGEDA